MNDNPIEAADEGAGWRKRVKEPDSLYDEMQACADALAQAKLWHALAQRSVDSQGLEEDGRTKEMINAMHQAWSGEHIRQLIEEESLPHYMRDELESRAMIKALVNVRTLVFHPHINHYSVPRPVHLSQKIGIKELLSYYERECDGLNPELKGRLRQAADLLDPFNHPQQKHLHYIGAYYEIAAAAHAERIRIITDNKGCEFLDDYSQRRQRLAHPDMNRNGMFSPLSRCRNHKPIDLEYFKEQAEAFLAANGASKTTLDESPSEPQFPAFKQRQSSGPGQTP